MKITFDAFMDDLQETNATLDSFTDFEKVSSNVRRIALKLSQLNYLLGKSDLRQAIEEIFAENPKSFEVLDILIAIRDSEKRKVIGPDHKVHLIKDYFSSVDGVLAYIRATGLAEVFQSRRITNLVDYVFGIEVGLDSNARKNRGGHVMENTVASVLEKACIPFRREVEAIGLKGLNGCLGKDLKRFDFVVETPRTCFLIETNFYNGGGSKLNEVARAYSEIAPKVNGCPGYEFIWITDGIGWASARSKLEEAYRIIPGIYNLSELQSLIDWMKKELAEGDNP